MHYICVKNAIVSSDIVGRKRWKIAENFYTLTSLIMYLRVKKEGQNLYLYFLFHFFVVLLLVVVYVSGSAHCPIVVLSLAIYHWPLIPKPPLSLFYIPIVVLNVDVILLKIFMSMTEKVKSIIICRRLIL